MERARNEEKQTKSVCVEDANEMNEPNAITVAAIYRSTKMNNLKNYVVE